MKKIILHPYNLNWPIMFAEEYNTLKKTLGDQYVAIHHVGSTSIPGQAAKNKIDIIAVVKNGKEAVKCLEEIGYTYKGEWNIPLKFGFTKRGKVDVNLHVYEQNHPEIEANIKFRDHLKSNPDQRDKYTILKEQILKDESSMEKSANGYLFNYTLRKGDFIRGILKETGFNRIRMLKASDQSEWQAIKHFRDKYFFMPCGIDDPYKWTFNHAEHAHLVLYQGVEIVGYAHIQFWSDMQAAIHMIVIQEDKRSQGYGNKFLALIEKWLKSLDIKSIHAKSRQSNLNFYYKNSYIKMPFDDPKNHESDLNDIPVGKLL